MNTTFRRNLLIGFGISLLLLILSSVASFFSINSLLYSADRVRHTNDIITNLESVISVLKDAETGQRGFLLTGDDRFLEPYNGSYEKALRLVNEVKTKTADNTAQQLDCDRLNQTITRRLSLLQNRIDDKRSGREISTDLLLQGKADMDGARSIIKTMQLREQTFLEERTGQLNRFSTIAPVFIIIAGMLAILVTVISFSRTMKDFKKRVELQQELQQKDEEISKRIALIQGIADKISAGDYKIRVGDEGKDTLGSLAGSLNKMAGSLDYSFSTLSDKEWMQTGVASLNESMLGEQTLEELATNILQFVAEYSGSVSGAFYLLNHDSLELIGSYALTLSEERRQISVGVGLVGQCAAGAKPIELTGINSTAYSISFATGDIKPSSIYVLPVFYEGRVRAVIEMASLNQYTAKEKEFFGAVSFNTGIVINTAQNRKRLQELLEETQAQSEELQTQHSELENTNAELEAQAEKLQASEEELKVQQEELQQANQELEERTRLLEERNELILERNIEIQHKAEELALSTKYKSEFLANMSHELRTPLNSILLLSRLLSENHQSNLTGDQIEYAQVIQSSGNGLLRLIDEILDLSKIESGKMELEYGDVSVEEMVQNMNDLFQPVAKEKGVQFTTTIEANVLRMIETDGMRVEQILKNLLSNALKFTTQGSVDLTISEEDGAVSFRVKDTGIGIAKDKQQSIFEAFQQADGSTRRKYGGTGLGLSISRELARLLKGKIDLQSEEGQGSTFTLVLPAKKSGTVLETPAAFVQPLVPSVQQSPLLPANETYNQYISDTIPEPVPDDREAVTEGDKVILIVEDDTAFAKSVLDFTRQKGYKGIVAVRGDEGIALAAKFKPLGILLDIQLPVKSGWEVMEELKSSPQTRHIPVHIMSSHEARAKSLSKGAVDFINKPVAFEKMREVFDRIEAVLSRDPKKVLIVEENTKHAEALAYFLENFKVASEVRTSVHDTIEALKRKEVDCVILDMGIPAQRSYETLEAVKKTPGLENLPIIIFTGKNLSHIEEARIKQYADSIVVKTAHSYQRILDEVSLFLHLVEDNKESRTSQKTKRLGTLNEVLKDKTVLIADDDVRNIFSLTKSLETYGINVLSAIDGKEALNQLASNAGTDLILMDMMMPEMDGYEAIKKVRTQYRYKDLPIIAVTAKAMTGDREKCIDAGASDYITKPVDIDQLLSLLRVWLWNKE